MIINETVRNMKRCNIIATGNSLRGYDIDSIPGFKIGINHAYKFTKVDTTCVLDDPDVYFMGCPDLQTTKEMGGEWEVRDSKGQMVFEEGVVGKLNFTILFAVNVAINLGYDDIHIYGCDNKLSEFNHFYDKRKPNENTAKRYVENFFWIDKLFNHVKPQLEDYNITFYNSEIKHFNNAEL